MAGIKVKIASVSDAKQKVSEWSQGQGIEDELIFDPTALDPVDVQNFAFELNVLSEISASVTPYGKITFVAVLQ